MARRATKAHERDAQKTRSHTRRAQEILALGFGSLAASLSRDAYEGICRDSRKWARSTREERGNLDTPKVTDAHGGTWTQLNYGSAGVLMAPDALPNGHPLFGKPAVLKIVLNARGVSADADAESVAEEFETMRLPGLAPYVPSTYGLVLVGDVPVGYSMQRYEKSLEKLVQKHGLNDAMEHTVYEVIKGVCAVVSCFDIKPANFVVSGTDVRMIDLASFFCNPPSEKSPERVSADVAMCTLLFCLAACETAHSGLTPLELPFLTSTLLESDKRPKRSVLDALESLDADGATVYRRAITNVQGECFRKVASKRFRGGAKFTAVELLSRLSDYKMSVATKGAAFGASEPPCAIL
jgi:hypothetical protein